MSRNSPLNETLVSLLTVRAELEREREKVESSLADMDRVIALVRARNSANGNEAHDDEEGPRTLSLGNGEPKSQPTDDRYQEMAIEALTEAGSAGLAPQQLRDDLGLAQPRFKVLVSKLVAGGEVSRIGGRGRGVRYVIPMLKVKNQPNGSAAHTCHAREM